MSDATPALEKAYVCAGCGAVFRTWSQQAYHGKHNKVCTRELRFWGRVNKNTPSGCWVWLGCVDKWGYGDLSWGGKHLQAHRVAWILLNGDPGKMDVLHKCNTPPCCNPEHLYLGTDIENAKDRKAVGAQHVEAKLTPDQVRAIRAEYVMYNKRRGNGPALAAKYGVSVSAITAITSGRTWKSVV